jgi:hypothetical protein
MIRVLSSLLLLHFPQKFHCRSIEQQHNNDSSDFPYKTENATSIIRAADNLGLKKALFVVGAFPLVSDKIFQDMLEENGFFVKAILDVDSVKLESPFFLHDDVLFHLIVISASVNSNHLRDPANITRSKYSDAPIPLLSWEEGTWDELGMTGPVRGSHLGVLSDAVLDNYKANFSLEYLLHVRGFGPTPNATVHIDAPQSPLAASLLGIVPLFTQPYAMGFGRVLGPGAQRIASLTDDPSMAVVFAYDRAAALHGGAPATARRAALFPYHMAEGDRVGCAAARACNPPDQRIPFTPQGLALVGAAIAWLAAPADDAAAAADDDAAAAAAARAQRDRQAATVLAAATAAAVAFAIRRHRRRAAAAAAAAHPGERRSR